MNPFLSTCLDVVSSTLSYPLVVLLYRRVILTLRHVLPPQLTAIHRRLATESAVVAATFGTIK